MFFMSTAKYIIQPAFTTTTMRSHSFFEWMQAEIPTSFLLEFCFSFARLLLLASQLTGWLLSCIVCCLAYCMCQLSSVKVLYCFLSIMKTIYIYANIPPLCRSQTHMAVLRMPNTNPVRLWHHNMHGEVARRKFKIKFNAGIFIVICKYI